jgi:hypothetical protein
MSRPTCGAQHPLEPTYNCCRQDVDGHSLHTTTTITPGGWSDEITWEKVSHDLAQQHDEALNMVVFGESEHGPWHVARAGRSVHLSCPGGSVLEDCGTDVDAEDRMSEIIVMTSDKHDAGTMRFRVTWDVQWKSCRECKDGNNYDSTDERVRPCAWCGGLTEVPDYRLVQLHRKDRS